MITLSWLLKEWCNGILMQVLMTGGLVLLFDNVSTVYGDGFAGFGFDKSNSRGTVFCINANRVPIRSVVMLCIERYMIVRSA
jgi:hypothetical protein